MAKKSKKAKSKAKKAKKVGSALVANEAALWASLSPLAEAALAFWNVFLGLRMGPNHNQLLDAAALARLIKIIRAVSWVESKHGTVGANQPARDPMQCGNPLDVWWRELTGQVSPEDFLTRGPGLSGCLQASFPARPNGSRLPGCGARLRAC